MRSNVTAFALFGNVDGIHQKSIREDVFQTLTGSCSSVQGQASLIYLCGSRILNMPSLQLFNA